MLQRFVILLVLSATCAAQSPERPKTAVPGEVLARYVGTYAIAPRLNLTITLVDGHLVSQMTGQGKVPLEAESATKFSVDSAKAEIEFPKDEQGQASQLILHQNGRDVTGKRLSDAEAKRISDAAALFDKRFKAQSAAPGSEAALRAVLAASQAGKPDYDRL